MIPLSIGLCGAALTTWLISPTWTPIIKCENSISELRQQQINGTKLQFLIRGQDRSNPVILFVHGGPLCPEIGFVRREQHLLEQRFTVVHYDQRGAGKSYHFGTDYSDCTVQQNIEDLIEVTDYVKNYLGKDKVILVGHSWGTYIGLQVASRHPENYLAYIGIGQCVDMLKSDMITWKKCLDVATQLGNTQDIRSLMKIFPDIKSGKKMIPRSLIAKYGFADRRGGKTLWDYILSTEYNGSDWIRFAVGVTKLQDSLMRYLLEHPLSDIVSSVDLPIFFVMGKYDGMTAPELARKYLEALNSNFRKEFVLFEESAHYPMFEESLKFYHWMCRNFT